MREERSTGFRTALGKEMPCDLSLRLPHLPAADVSPKSNPVTAPKSPFSAVVTNASMAHNVVVSTVSSGQASLGRPKEVVTKAAPTTTAITTRRVRTAARACCERFALDCRIIGLLGSLACACSRCRCACCCLSHKLDQILHFSHRYPPGPVRSGDLLECLVLFFDQDRHCHARQCWQSLSAFGKFDRSVEQFRPQGGSDWNVPELTIGCGRERVK